MNIFYVAQRRKPLVLITRKTSPILNKGYSNLQIYDVTLKESGLLSTCCAQALVTQWSTQLKFLL